MSAGTSVLLKSCWSGPPVSIFVALHHVTHYKYDRPIDLGPQTIRLRPAPHTRTPILSYSLKVAPSNHFVNWQQDPQGNWLARFVFPDKATELKIEVDFTAQMTVINPFDFFVEPYADSFPFAYTNDLKTELAPYLATIEPGPLFAKYLADIPREATSTVNFLVDLNAQLQKKIRYIIRMEPGVQTPEQTLAAGAGSCRDSAWLLIQILRRADLRFGRRSGIAGMEYFRGWTDQARPRRRSHPTLADAVRAGRASTLRAGQMVSGRKPAALGVRPLLAQGWRADLEEFRSDRDDREPAQGQD